jgi:purine-nucleoside phosphorylase
MESDLPKGWAEILGAEQRPRLAIVLGSGLSTALDGFELLARTPYRDLPGFPDVTVTGHHGELLLLRVGNQPLVGVSGRTHIYEDQGAYVATHYVRYLRNIECKILIISNAAGCCNDAFSAGDWMMLEDHVNMTCATPLTGASFVDMSNCYDVELRDRFRAAALRIGMPLREGVYLAVRGPQYETPAEVRAFRLLGADAIGMSTVLEVIQARAAGLRVAAFSCLTNRAAGTGAGALDHREVLDVGRTAAPAFARLLREVIPEILA